MKATRNRAHGRARPTQGSDAPEIDPLDWDFSSCPPGELTDCYRYEFARESEMLKQSAQAWRNGIQGCRFDDWVSVARKNSRRSRPHFFGWEPFNFYPEWPQQPYLAVKVPERARRRNLLPKLQRTRRSASALRRLDVCSLMQCEPTLMIDQSEVWAEVAGAAHLVKLTPREPDLASLASGDGAIEIVAFQVDWRHSDGVLKECFEHWLASRPKQVKRWEIKGKGNPREQIKSRLKQLGAMRLLRSHHWTEAARITEAVAGKPLFNEQSSWIRAAANAAELCGNLSEKIFFSGED